MEHESKPRILHLIIGLNNGGAERTLLRLCTQSALFEHTVVSLTGDGELSSSFRDAAISVIPLSFRSLRGIVSGFKAIVRAYKALSPNLVQTWLYHADLVGAGLKVLAPRAPVVWNLRHSVLIKSHSIRTKVIRSVLAGLSWFIPSRIISAGNSVTSVHERIGYRANRITTIPNGVDLDRFRRDCQKSLETRAELKVDSTVFLIGFIAKWDKQKGVETFLESLELLASWGKNFQFVLVGDGLVSNNPELIELLKRSGLQRHCHLVGPTPQVDRYLCAVDVVVSASLTEGFPNVVAEAMACEKPVVATRVGESGALIERDDLLSAPGSAADLAESILSIHGLSQTERDRIGAENRRRLESAFPQSFLVERYEEVWVSVMKFGPPTQAFSSGQSSDPHNSTTIRR